MKELLTSVRILSGFCPDFFVGNRKLILSPQLTVEGSLCCDSARTILDRHNHVKIPPILRCLVQVWCLPVAYAFCPDFLAVGGGSSRSPTPRGPRENRQQNLLKHGLIRNRTMGIFRIPSFHHINFVRKLIQFRILSFKIRTESGRNPENGRCKQTITPDGTQNYLPTNNNHY